MPQHDTKPAVVGCPAALVVVVLTLTLNARARLSREVWALRVERLLSFAGAVPGVVLVIGVAAADLAGRATD